MIRISTMRRRLPSLGQHGNNLVFATCVALSFAAFPTASFADEIIIGTAGPTFIQETAQSTTPLAGTNEVQYLDYKDTALSVSAPGADFVGSANAMINVDLTTGFIKMKVSASSALNPNGSLTLGGSSGVATLDVGFTMSIFSLAAGSGVLELFQTGNYSTGVDGYIVRTISTSIDQNTGTSFNQNNDITGSGNFSIEDDHSFTYGAGVTNFDVSAFINIETWGNASYDASNTAFLNLVLSDGATVTAPITFNASDTSAPTGAPEPFTLSIFGGGLAGAAAMRRCKAKRA